MEEESWTCSKCTLINSKANVSCSMCDSARFSGSGSSSSSLKSLGSSRDQMDSDMRMAIRLSSHEGARNDRDRTGAGGQMSSLEKLAATNRLVQEQSRIITQRTGRGRGSYQSNSLQNIEPQHSSASSSNRARSRGGRIVMSDSDSEHSDRDRDREDSRDDSREEEYYYGNYNHSHSQDQENSQDQDQGYELYSDNDYDDYSREEEDEEDEEDEDEDDDDIRRNKKSSYFKDKKPSRMRTSNSSNMRSRSLSPRLGSDMGDTHDLDLDLGLDLPPSHNFNFKTDADADAEETALEDVGLGEISGGFEKQKKARLERLLAKTDRIVNNLNASMKAFIEKSQLKLEGEVRR